MNNKFNFNEKNINLLKMALIEDLGDRGDITSKALVLKDTLAEAVIISKSKAEYILSGVDVAKKIFELNDINLKIIQHAFDGEKIINNQKIITVIGSAQSILSAERVSLNFLQRMTGIASLTNAFVIKTKKYGTKILDTRKTTPLLREFEKYAVLCGGGYNHRMGLYDSVLIKDNHRFLWRKRFNNTFINIADAVKQVREEYNNNFIIEIEVESKEEMLDALTANPDWILLDNMPAKEIKECVSLCNKRCKLEASGGINIKNIEEIAATLVDAISLGAITHSAAAADFSLEFIN